MEYQLFAPLIIVVPLFREPLIQYYKDLSLLEYIDADRDLKTISSDIKQKMA